MNISSRTHSEGRAVGNAQGFDSWRQVAVLAALMAIMLAIILLGSGRAFAAASSSEAAFLQWAVQANIAEIQAGQLAEQQAQNPEVKDYGRMLRTDHTKGKMDITALAKTMSIDVPVEADADAQAEAVKLQSLSGAAFDKEFIDHMIEGHKKVIAKFQEQAKAGNDEVAQLAQGMLPILEKHLATAEGIAQKIGE